MGRVVHFEIFADDAGASADFYREALGWDVSAWEGPFEYHLVTTGPNDQMGINGAIAPYGSAGDQRVVLTIGVGDLDAAIGRAVTSGATLVGEKGEIEGVGTHVYMRDPGGTVFGLLQPLPMGSGEPGRDVWAEFGDSLKQLGESVAGAFSDAAGSPQGQRARQEAERAMQGIRDASTSAADKARPHVISALDRVSLELGNLASRLRREDVASEPVVTGEPMAEPPMEPDDQDEGYTPPPPNPEC